MNNTYSIYNGPLFVAVKYHRDASINPYYKKSTYMIICRVSDGGGYDPYCFNIRNDIDSFRVDPLPVMDNMLVVKDFDYHRVIRGLFTMNLDSRAKEILSKIGIDNHGQK